MNILDRIIEHKRMEVEASRNSVTVAELERSSLFKRETFSLKKSLSDENSTGIIAEFKRQSPSKGIINGNANVVKITSAYAEHGAAGLSVLTDNNFFGGTNDDLIRSRINQIPILRKDFIINQYQLFEAKAIGADVILLIAACLSKKEVARLASTAKSIGLEVLLEIHNDEELEHICDDCDIVGINNRNLRDFTVDVQRSIDLGAKIPSGKIKISESGITDTGTIQKLRSYGFSGFLIGENFMKEHDPSIAFASFVKHLKTSPSMGGTK